MSLETPFGGMLAPGMLRPPGISGPLPAWLRVPELDALPTEETYSPYGVAEAPEEYTAYAKTVDPRYEYWACLALKHTPQLGPRTWKRLMETFGGAWQAVSQTVAWESRRIAPTRVVQAFRQGVWQEAAREEWRQATDGSHHVLLWTHSRYPRRLRAIPDPPLFLYYRGQLALLPNVGVAIVGARRCSEYGRSMAWKLAKGLAKAGVTVISGLAYGIDRAAHLAALQEVGSTVAVLGAGLDSGYPAGNADVRRQLESKGLIISELSPCAMPEAHQFPVRNRIISGLSLGTVVVEAGERSGGLITAQRAMEQGREVMAVPGRADWPSFAGCLRLINDGARAVTSAEDILRELAPQLAEEQFTQAGPTATEQAAPSNLMPEDVVSAAARPGGSPRKRKVAGDPSRQPAIEAPVVKEYDLSHLDGEARLVWQALPESGIRHIDEVCQELGWESAKVSRNLLTLELAGFAKQLPGMLYARA